MKPTATTKLGLTLAGVLALVVTSARADSFGSGGNAFTIDFVNIGNAGNGADPLDGDQDRGGTQNFGGVSYQYRLGMLEISQNQIDNAVATAGGVTNVTAGAWTGSQPAANIDWYEAAAFVNWLNTSTGHQAAYNLTFSGGWSMTLWSSGDAWQTGGENLYRHKDAFYFLPSVDEWYKGAFHQNDGVTANYWLYPTASNSAPSAVASGTAANTAVYGAAGPSPADVAQNGGLSAYGTRGQGGNVYEWMESAVDGSNNSATESRGLRSGDWNNPSSFMAQSKMADGVPTASLSNIGLRVASVPEPSSALLLAGAGLGLLLRRRHAQGSSSLPRLP